MSKITKQVSECEIYIKFGRTNLTDECISNNSTPAIHETEVWYTTNVSHEFIEFLSKKQHKHCEQTHKSHLNHQ